MRSRLVRVFSTNQSHVQSLRLSVRTGAET